MRMDRAAYSRAGRTGIYKLRDRSGDERENYENGVEPAHARILAQRDKLQERRGI